jgi:hypothetical protein
LAKLTNGGTLGEKPPVATRILSAAWDSELASEIIVSAKIIFMILIRIAITPLVPHSPVPFFAFDFSSLYPFFRFLVQRGKLLT